MAFRNVHLKHEYNKPALEQKHDQGFDFMYSNKIDRKRMLSLREQRK